MSIRSDRWTRCMAEEHRMIEPFAPEQVRTAGGHRIISYGTSSYGYDVRCAPEFKMFTDINSTIVDPKDFDHGSFVDRNRSSAPGAARGWRTAMVSGCSAGCRSRYGYANRPPAGRPTGVAEPDGPLGRAYRKSARRTAARLSLGAAAAGSFPRITVEGT